MATVPKILRTLADVSAWIDSKLANGGLLGPDDELKLFNLIQHRDLPILICWTPADGWIVALKETRPVNDMYHFFASKDRKVVMDYYKANFVGHDNVEIVGQAQMRQDQ